MNDMFETPRTAREEMAQRIEVLKRQSEREMIEAANLRRQADELDASADTRRSIAREYEAIVEKSTAGGSTASDHAERIRSGRAALGMSQKALAEQAGVDRGVIARAEGGETVGVRPLTEVLATLDRLERETGS
jgi:ribosome-binding protein aMBF1 (putative translation factor)